MDFLFRELIQYGALGIIAGLSIWQSWQVQKKLVELVKENTTATIENVSVLRELKETIKDCQIIHREGGV